MIFRMLKRILLVALLFHSAESFSGPGPIYGTVYGYDGKPLPEARVRAFDEDELQSGGIGPRVNRDEKMGEAITDKEGKYRITYKSYDEKHWDGPKTRFHTNWRPDVYLVVAIQQDYNNEKYWSKRYVSKVHMNHPMRDPLKIDIRLPPGKCGAGEPLNCSIPWLAKVIEPHHWITGGAGKIPGLFNSACKRHDYCYRHGFLTYGKSKAKCDKDFMDDMSDACTSINPAAHVLTAGLSTSACLATAGEMFGAVSLLGDKDFRKKNGSICEYEGPQQPISGGAGSRDKQDRLR